MAKYLFIYHGGKMPESPEEIEQTIRAWRDWLDSMGDAVVDDGNPVGLSTTVHSDGSVSDDGGSNPASGYGLIEATSREDAVEKAKGCPILAVGGSVELAEAIEVM